MKKKVFIIKLIEVCRLKSEDYLRGQGVVESVVAVGILMMMLTGTVLLISFGLSNRKTGFDRRKANELATLVMEEQVAKSISDTANFWKLSNQLTPVPKTEFPGYSYTIGFTNVTTVINPRCGIGRTDCAQVVINIGWSGKETQNLKYERFFSRN